MLGPTVFVPWSVLRHPELNPTQKRLWAVLVALGQAGVDEILLVSGHARETFYRHRAKLEQLGVLGQRRIARERYRFVCTAAAAQAGLAVPVELVFDPAVAGPGLLIWAAIADKTPTLPLRTLSTVTGLHWRTMNKYLDRLTHEGWVRGDQACNPYAEIRAKQAEIDGYCTTGLSYGQALMTGFITLIVNDNKFKIEAQEPFLTNPMGPGTMRYDLYFEQYRVAFEFHGPQHFYPTKEFPSLTEFAERRARDLFKLGLSAQQEIKCWVLTARDLTLKRLHEITVGLPHRDLRNQGHLVTYLEAEAAEHADRLSRVPAAMAP